MPVLNLLFSISILCYFFASCISNTKNSADNLSEQHSISPSYKSMESDWDPKIIGAIIINIIHIIAELIILILIVRRQKILSKDSLSIASLETVYRKFCKQQSKLYAFSHNFMLAYAICIFSLSCILLLVLISRLFHWMNYDYIIACFCCINLSLNTVSISQKHKQYNSDGSITFCIQIHKYFCLIFATIIIGVAASEPVINSWVLCMAWLLFLTKAKQSLGKNIIYYLLLFFQIIVSFTIIGVAIFKLKSKDTTGIPHYICLVFICIVIAKQLCQVGCALKSFEGDTNFKIDSHNDTQIYYKLSKFLVCSNQYKSRQYAFDISQERGKVHQDKEPDVQQQINPQESEINVSPFYKKRQKQLQKHSKRLYYFNQQCPICLQGVQIEKFIIQLKCNHRYHIDCIEQWIVSSNEESKGCPMCRKFIDLN